MDEWDDVVRIEVDGKPYDKKPFPPKTELGNYPWMIVRLVNGGNREIQFFKMKRTCKIQFQRRRGCTNLSKTQWKSEKS
jgi:hypothetical protein